MGAVKFSCELSKAGEMQHAAKLDRTSFSDRRFKMKKARFQKTGFSKN